MVDGSVKAYVTRTGGWSNQGSLLRAALFARRCVWAAEKTQLYLIFFAVALLYIFSMGRRIGIAMQRDIEKSEAKIFSSWVKFVWVFNPIGDIYKIFKPEWPLGIALISWLAKQRLVRVGVRSVDMDSNSICGGVTTMVFDKTG